MNTTVLENRVKALADEVRILRKDLHRPAIDEGDIVTVKSSIVLCDGDDTLSLRSGDKLAFSNYVIDGNIAKAALYYNEHKTGVLIPLYAFESMIRLGVFVKAK